MYKVWKTDRRVVFPLFSGTPWYRGFKKIWPLFCVELFSVSFPFLTLSGTVLKSWEHELPFNVALFLEKSENNFQNLRRSWAIYLTKLSCLALNKSVRPLNKMQKTSSRRAAILCRIVLDEFLTTEDNPCTLGKLKNSTTFQRGLILGKVLWVMMGRHHIGAASGCWCNYRRKSSQRSYPYTYNSFT